VSLSDERVIAGRYRLETVLGHGGMGHVYAGHDLRLGRPVAVKLLRSDLATDPETCRRFEREAQMAARVTDPHIVTIYDTGEDDVPFIVMERLPGRTLADEIAEGPLEVPRLHLIANEMLAALEAAHTRGVLHRDIKPRNVLITADDHAKVGDFGIAKSTDDASETTALFGTAAYLAPERLAGHQASTQSDLFSLGVVLYEAATGIKPFQADSPLATANAIAHEQAPPLATLRPDLDAAFIRSVERALRKEPDERFATAADMATAIRGVETSKPVADDETVRIADEDHTAIMPPVVGPKATQPGTPPRPDNDSRRTRIAVFAAMLVLAAIALAGWAASRGSDSPATPPTTQSIPAISPVPTTRPTIPTTVPRTQAPPANGKGHGKGNGNNK
jgi:eukaryotic-like serine/threonine-protein kinase